MKIENKLNGFKMKKRLSLLPLLLARKASAIAPGVWLIIIIVGAHVVTVVRMQAAIKKVRAGAELKAAGAKEQEPTTKVLQPIPNFEPFRGNEFACNLISLSWSMSRVVGEMRTYCARNEWSVSKHEEFIKHAEELGRAAGLVERWAIEIAKDNQ